MPRLLFVVNFKHRFWTLSLFQTCFAWFKIPIRYFPAEINLSLEKAGVGNGYYDWFTSYCMMKELSPPGSFPTFLLVSREQNLSTGVVLFCSLLNSKVKDSPKLTPLASQNSSQPIPKATVPSLVNRYADHSILFAPKRVIFPSLLIPLAFMNSLGRCCKTVGRTCQL